MSKSFNPPPGWATPIALHFERSFLSRLLGLFRSKDNCHALTQGTCPGVDQCHDCHWGEGSVRKP